MKKFRSIISLLLIAVLVFGLVGCGSKEASNNDTGNNAAVNKEPEKKILRFGTVDTKANLDISLCTYNQVMDITDHVVESLVRYDNDLKLQPWLLKSLPTVSSDGMTYSFELKPGVKFHNGETLKSSDVKFTFERFFTPSTGVLMTYILDMVKGADKMLKKEATTLEGFKIIDDTKFEITLQYAYAPFVSALATSYSSIYPEKACTEAGKDWGVKTLIGTGPYVLKEYNIDTGVTLVKNESYHGNAPKIDELQYKFIADPNTRVMEFEKGNIDILQLDATLYKNYASDPKFEGQIHEFTPLGLIFINPNNKLEKYNNPKVREALSYAVDREKLTKELLFGTAKPATSFIPPGMMGYNKDAAPYEYNVEKAKQLLAEAGYPNGIELEAICPSKYAWSSKVFTAIQAMVKPAGIELKVTQVDAATWTDMRNSGKVTMALGNWYTDFMDPDAMIYSFLHSKNNKTLSNNYVSAEFDKLLDDARSITDEAKREEMYKQADELATRKDYAVIPLYNETMYYMAKPYVKDFFMPANYVFHFYDCDIDLEMKNKAK